MKTNVTTLPKSSRPSTRPRAHQDLQIFLPPGRGKADLAYLRNGCFATAALSAVFVLFCGNLMAEDGVRDLEAPVNPRAQSPCPAAHQYSLLRPDPPGVPTIVALGLFFQDISNLSDVDQTMSADIYLLARWRDPRLADAHRGDGSADCPVPVRELWMPAIEPENLRSRQLFYDPRFLVDGRGIITFVRRQLVQVSYPRNFRNFPFDSHQWKLTLWPTLSTTDEIQFHPLQRLVARNGSASVQGWKIGAPTAVVGIDRRGGHIGEFSRFDVILDLQRDWAYYAWKLGLPLILIVLMAYCVYYIPSSAVAQQIGVSMTAMLTLIAYMLALSNSLPKISYLTRADRFFIGSAILVFVGLVKAALTTAWLQRGDIETIDWVDRFGRFSYPVAMLVNFLIAFVW